MEEILASIRRIIESNEPNAENALSGQLPPVYGDDEIEDGEETGFVPDMAANDRGAPSRNEPMNYAQGSSSQPAQQDRTLSLADVAARVRAASARQQEAGPVRLATASTAPTPSAPVSSAQTSSSSAPVARQEEPAPLRPQMPRMPEFREPVSQSPVTQAAPASQPVAPQPEPVQRVMMPVFDPPLSAPLRVETPVRPEPKTEPKLAAEPAPRSLPAKIEETANLLSAEAGAQVAKSFSELASVFNGMERRSLEEMAGDMLRPMLQEWLDDNLPTLVERLVREEIERVSRGTRR
jgi:cell pole-organizing protein PopZ